MFILGLQVYLANLFLLGTSGVRAASLRLYNRHPEFHPVIGAIHIPLRICFKVGGAGMAVALFGEEGFHDVLPALVNAIRMPERYLLKT